MNLGRKQIITRRQLIGQGGWWSTYFGSDPTAPWRERPGILPIDFDRAGNVIVKTGGRLPALEIPQN